MGENKEKEVTKIPLERIPQNIRMPEQLTEEELRREVVILRNRLVQAEQKLQELGNMWGLKRLELMFEIVKNKDFGEETLSIVRNLICQDLGISDELKENNE